MKDSHDRLFWSNIRMISLDMVKFYLELYKKHGLQKYMERAKVFGETSLLAKARLDGLSTG